MTTKEQAYKHGQEDGRRLAGGGVDNKKALWWVELLFNLQKFECLKMGDESKAAEVDEVRKYIEERLKGDEENDNSI